MSDKDFSGSVGVETHVRIGNDARQVLLSAGGSSTNPYLLVGGATPATSAPIGLQYGYTPADRGWLGWTMDPDVCASTTALATSGTLYVFRAKVPINGLITNVVYQITTLGNTLTTGQCFVGIATPAGVLIGKSADQAAIWASPGTTGVKTTALVGGPFAVTTPEIEVWMLFVGTTGPTLPRGNGNAIINTGFTNSRFATADTGITAFPTTRAALSALSVSYCLGVN